MKDRITVGDEYIHQFQFQQSDVIGFAEASGDKNPIHLDAEYASKTIFGRTIVHGFLGGSVFSKVFGTIFPGEGTIYLKQDMAFFKPMFTDEPYRAIFKVSQVFPEKNRALISTVVENGNGEVIISGEALIKHGKIS